MRDVPRRNSPESIIATDGDIDLSAKDESIAASDTDYIPPSEHGPVMDTKKALTVKSTSFNMEDDIFNISSPVSNHSNQTSDRLPVTPTYHSSSDGQPSYIVASNFYKPSEDDLLPLYTDDYDDEILESQFPKEDPFLWSSALSCIQRYA